MVKIRRTAVRQERGCLPCLTYLLRRGNVTEPSAYPKKQKTKQKTVMMAAVMVAAVVVIGRNKQET